MLTTGVPVEVWAAASDATVATALDSLARRAAARRGDTAAELDELELDDEQEV